MLDKNKLTFIKYLVVLWNMDWTREYQTEQITYVANNKGLNKMRIKR